MTCVELCDLLRDFQSRTESIRGLVVHEEAISVSLDSDGSGELQAMLAATGSTVDERLVFALRTDCASATARFCDLAHLERLLRGTESPVWRFPDE